MNMGRVSADMIVIVATTPKGSLRLCKAAFAINHTQAPNALDFPAQLVARTARVQESHHMPAQAAQSELQEAHGSGRGRMAQPLAAAVPAPQWHGNLRVGKVTSFAPTP